MDDKKARLELMKPAWGKMRFVEHKYQSIEEGRESLEDLLPWIREANRQVENLVPSDDLRLAMLDRPTNDDRYRLSRFE